MQLEKSEHSFHITLDDGDIIIDTNPEERFDRLIRIAKHTFNVPIALICLKDSQQGLWLKSSQGLPMQAFTPCKQSLCHAVISSDDDVLHIADIELVDSPYKSCCVPDAQAVRCYAGVSIILSRQKIGSLCIFDYQARTLNVEDLAILCDLAHCVEVELEKTHRKQLAQQYHHQKEHLSVVLDTIVDGVITIDTRGIIKTVNKTMLRIFGYSAEELLGNSVNMLMPEPFSSAHDGYMNNYLSTHQAKIIGIGREVIGLRKNGRLFPMNLAVGEMKKNKHKQFVGIIRDMTEQKKNQLALEAFKYVLDHTVDCVFLCRTNTLDFTYINKGMQQQLGYSEVELLTMTVNDINPEFDYEQYQQLINSLLTNDKLSLTIETLHRHKDGHDIPVETTLQIIKQTEKKPRLLVIVRDITERKAVERMKSQFVSTVSHELRTPLTSIRGALGLVLGGALGEIPEKALAMLTMASRNSERLTLLINDLLDLEKIESELMVFAFETVDLVQVVHQSLESTRGYAEGYAVTLQLHSAVEQAWIHADEHRLLQVLANLLSNAIKFSHAGGVVKLHIMQQEGSYKVLVQDQGDGIPKAFRARIFERFAQADSADNRQKGGSGLGLSISKAIVERHQGSIDFDSVEGLGSTFFFSLPAKEMPTGTTENVEQDTPHTGVNCGLPFPSGEGWGEGISAHSIVLLCKNNGVATDSLIRLLEQEGFSCDVICNVAEARLLLSQNKYSLMVLDISLSELNSMAFIHELHNLPNAEKLGIIITSLDEESKTWPRVVLAGHFQQTISRDRLHSALQLALSAHRHTRILHIEDDLDIIELVKSILSNTTVDYHAATSLANARLFLAAQEVDLVILDLSLPDGSGMELLTELEGRCQVVVFSAHYMNNTFSQQVAAVLIKSTTDNEQLLATIRRVLNA